MPAYRLMERYTSKQVGDAEHIKVCAKPRRRENLVPRKTILKAWPSSMKFWNEPDWSLDRLRNARDPPGGDWQVLRSS
jgi:hypothetical protein